MRQSGSRARLGLVVGTALWTVVAAGQEPVRPRFDPATFEAHVRFLSSDLLEGRGIATRGGNLAVEYIEAVFRAAGLRPGFGTSFRQPVPMTTYRADPSTEVIATAGRVRARLRFGEEIVAINHALPEAGISSELLFVGYGIHAPEQGWDDYEGTDVKGRLLLAFVNEPGRDDPELFGGAALTIHGRWTEKLAVAARLGAAGMILIHTDEDAGYGWHIPAQSMTREKFHLTGDPDLIPCAAWITHEALSKLLGAVDLRIGDLRAAAERRGFRPRSLPIQVRIRAQRSTQQLLGYNVVGILPGDKPHSIVLSAHHDHLGIGPEVDGDRIYNGAVDNGTALAMLLTLAQSLAATPSANRPTLVFAAVDAEEEGLLGSTFYTRSPAVPLADTLANINFEMTNAWGRTRDVIAIGAEQSGLGEMVGRVAARRGMRVTPDAAPEQGFFFRSDQLSFARAGIPAIWLDGGTDYEERPPGWGETRRQRYRTEGYHRPADEVGDDWDFRGLVQLAELTVDLIEEVTRAGKVRWAIPRPPA